LIASDAGGLIRLQRQFSSKFLASDSTPHGWSWRIEGISFALPARGLLILRGLRLRCGAFSVTFGHGGIAQGGFDRARARRSRRCADQPAIDCIGSRLRLAILPGAVIASSTFVL
jgi:hypothetical protein